MSTTDVETFVEYVLRGSVSFACGGRSIHVPRCGLLRVSRSLVRLCTFPALYEVEAHESVLDGHIDLRSFVQAGRIVVEIWEIGRESEKLTASLQPLDALRTAGAFHVGILLEIFRRCPSLQYEALLLTRVTDGFAIAGLAFLGAIGPKAAR